MPRPFPAAFAALSLWLALTAAAPRPATPARRAPAAVARPGDGWPATPAAEHARGWVEAFGKGETAMRGFLATHLAPAELAVRGLDARLETYRGNLERFGSFMLVSVDSSGPTGIKVTLAAADLSQQHFAFYTEAKPPYRLVRVYRTETRTGHGGFGH